MTHDQIALRIMLSDLTPAARDRELAALRKRAERDLGIGAECPACGAHTEQTNGRTGEDLTYCCEECGEHFDA